MRVYEKINELKGTNATKEQMAEWAYMNRICPITFEDGLELDCEYPERLDVIAEICCSQHKCGTECLNDFLEREVEQ